MLLMRSIKHYILLVVWLLGSVAVLAQERTVENRPYTDLRPFHFGVVAGLHFQDLELENVGPITINGNEGESFASYVSVDQDRWDPGFQVGVLGEARLGTYFAFRLAPTMLFANRHLTFLNFTKPTDTGEPTEERQNLKSVYIAAVMDVIFAAKRFNNHRPYVLAGITPVLNLTSRDNDYLRLKKGDVFFDVGIGCDFYMPFFKLRPELKFMYGLSNCLDKGHADRLRDPNMQSYARSVSAARSKMICLSFYFE